MAAPKDLLRSWLGRQIDDRQAAWLDGSLEKTAAGDDKTLYVALGLAPRKLGKADLALTDGDLDAARQARGDWDPRGWSVDQAARVLLVLAAAERDPQRFPEVLDQLCNTAEVGELVAIYRGLPLYPDPESLTARAAEGARTNMQAVFETVAHRNPFPKENFDELRWNHMVLKALFIGAVLHPIQGLDDRANPQLARMLVDFAHERWAAGRDVSPELWRCVVPFANREMEADLGKALELGAHGGAAGAALALAARGDALAARLLERAPKLKVQAEQGTLSWETIVP